MMEPQSGQILNNFRQDNRIKKIKVQWKFICVLVTLWQIIFSCGFVDASQDNTTLPLILFYTKDTTLSSAFKEEFQRRGFRVIDDSDLRSAKQNYMRQLRDKGVQEQVLEAIQEKYDDEELSKGALASDELKIANALASSLKADYYAIMKYEFLDLGKDPEFGFYVVKVIIEELKIVNPNSLETLAVFSGTKTGLGNDMKSAKIKASKNLAKLLTLKIYDRVKDISQKDKTLKLVISNVLDTKTSIKFSQILKNIAGVSPKRSFDSTQHSSVYTFPFTGDKDDFMLQLMEKATTIDGIDELDIIDEQESISQINIKAVIKIE